MLGTLQMVRSVTPLDVMQLEVNSKETVFAENESCKKEIETSINSVEIESAHREHSDKTCSQTEKMNCNWMSDVDLDGLSKKQKVMVQKMLQEERNSFSCDGEIGNAEGLQMNVNLTDSISVQKSYTSIYSTVIVPRSETLRGRLVKQGICSKISLIVLVTSSLREKKRWKPSFVHRL